MATGQADVKRYAHQLRDMIIEGRATPSFVVSKNLPPSHAPDAYARFDKRERVAPRSCSTPAWADRHGLTGMG